MKIKKIAELVQREERLYICHWNGMCREMVGPPCALYEVDDLPSMNRDAWLAAMDVPAGKKDDISDQVFVDGLPGDFKLDLQKILGTPVVEDRPALVFIDKGKTIWAMQDTLGRITFLDAALLLPIEEKVREIHLLRRDKARYLFCVMVGMELRAILCNYDMHGKDERETFEKVTAAIPRETRAQRQADETAEQMVMPEEGEA